MKLDTFLKASALALDVFHNQSTKQLSGLVRNGVKRRMDRYAGPPQGDATQQPRRSAPTAQTIPHKPSANVRQSSSMTPFRQQAPYVRQPMFDPRATEHVKKAMRYVTPENAQKVAQWHSIFKSFLSKD
ncbi:hypothetical protein [Ferroacidibacillus organovorans]|uniref:Uncharacterized protein n=1 Tax=Ferroacidibacillus organovorans TaxID=1765683 RepID=A0A162S4J7_9BACL|nr:hypothetical protein [Ferroacidibacillus organovorans]KYP79517.1 hypothetical protein AYJ22_14515 [Ferroacidibacillus organovorans]OAG87247.1 hypothetical protein AYW79_14740 [Ferroacidibacillus organovorans]OPG17469.1 hypothetical protein B2M26_01700 [Ferroacidibacillus organovorans]